MPIVIENLGQIDALPFDDIIDVRSPSEYADDHLPGAISLPVLSDAERAEVGTIYKQTDTFLARKIGAAMVARNAANHLQGPLADKPGGWRPLVYCWRGGQRSGSFASILSQIGWRVDTIAGGYKSYRSLVVDVAHGATIPHRVILIDGNTGTAKTDILALLAARGYQVIDLEGLSGHRGSVFGDDGGPQPSQRKFESGLAVAISNMDPAKPVILEAESSMIGRRQIPSAIWTAMTAAPRISLAAPLDERAKYLVRAYADLTSDRAWLAERIGRLRAQRGKETVSRWQDLAASGDFETLAAELMDQHYDPGYRKSRKRGADVMMTVDVASLAADRLDAAADKVAAAIEDVVGRGAV